MFVYVLSKLGLAVVEFVTRLFSGFKPAPMSWDWTEDFFSLIDIVFYLIPVYDLIPLIFLIVCIILLRVSIGLIRFVIDIFV